MNRLTTWINKFENLLLINTRVTLTVLVMAALIVVISTWQFAYGLVGKNAASQTAGQTAKTDTGTGQSSDGSDSSSSTPDDYDNIEQANPSTGDTNGNADADTGSDPSATGSTGAVKGGIAGTISSIGSTIGGVVGGTVGGVIQNPPVSVAVLSIPKSGTVLSLSGLDYNISNYMPKTFGGMFSRAPYKFTEVNYPASAASDSITKGVASLNSMVRSTPGQKIVLAHSQGAQVASRWMRQYANDPTAPGAGELTFILLGNPLRATGGHAIGNKEIDGVIGLPTPINTKWPIVDVARRYDGWSDWVQDTSNQWAVNNADAGRRTYHTHYDVVNFYAPSSTVWKIGNTTFVLTKEDDLPVWKDNSQYPLSVRTAVRAYIETAYKNRPSNDPRTTLLPIEASWKSQLQQWGVPF